jgi:tripartite-type tricarboxylate transporter receptor subunit TctC
LLPVVMTTSQPNVLAVGSGVPAKTVKEFAEWLRARSGQFNYSSLGMGSSAHLTMELFLAEVGATGTHVPFNGSPPAAMAVAQGEADATFMVAPALLSHVRAGKVRLLAVSSAQRPDSLKDVPTLAEAGYPNVESLAWNGLFTAAGTPEAVVQKINADVNIALQDPGLRSALDSQGLTPVGGSVADFAGRLRDDMSRWGAIITKIGVKLDQ